jgi:hypothetical protein
MEWRLLLCFFFLSVGLHIFPLVSELVKSIEQNSVYGPKSIVNVQSACSWEVLIGMT